MFKRMLTLLLSLALMLTVLSPASALGEAENAPAVTDVALDLLGCSVHYPQLTGMDDPRAQAAANAAIMQAGQIEARISRMAVSRVFHRTME